MWVPCEVASFHDSVVAPPPGPVVPKQWPADGGAVRGEGDHKGRPYESFDSGNTAAPLMDNPRPVSRGIMPEPRRWGTSEKHARVSGGDFPVPRRRGVFQAPSFIPAGTHGH